MKLNPYITFNGTCEEAMNYYKDCFDGSIESMQRYGDSPMGNEGNKNKVLHSTLKFGESIIMAADSSDDKSASGSNISLSVNYANPELMEKIFATLSDGGVITMPLQDTFWGVRFGICRDKFGVNWMFNCDIK